MTLLQRFREFYLGFLRRFASNLVDELDASHQLLIFLASFLKMTHERLYDDQLVSVVTVSPYSSLFTCRCCIG